MDDPLTIQMTLPKPLPKDSPIVEGSTLEMRSKGITQSFVVVAVSIDRIEILVEEKKL